MTMIEDITKAVAAYRRLGTTEKRLFREEVGLKGPRDGVKRRRKAGHAAVKATATTAAPVRRNRKKKDAAAIAVTETGDTVQ
jgi:hypothetical protein